MKKEGSIFSGSYSADDVEFLLTPMQVNFTNVAEKEFLIQSGQKHYSDMLSEEPAPSFLHMQLYRDAMDGFAGRVAREVQALAKGLVNQIAARPIVLTSLVRAGVPLAVCLLHALRDMGVESVHYGVSIIRDRGLNRAAMACIEQRHGSGGVVFVDGWTGKGAISMELDSSLKGYPAYGPVPKLLVLADPGGCAWLSASGEDWLIPFGILGAPICGLVSRSLWCDEGFHGAMLCDHLRGHDISAAFISNIDALRRGLNEEVIAVQPDDAERHRLHVLSQRVITHLAECYQVDSINHIKPGIAEATRALMRRVPEHVLVSDKSDQDLALLLHLASNLNIDVEEIGSQLGVYRAVTIIKKISREE